MIRVASFCELSATKLSIEIEKFIKLYKITKEQIISLTYSGKSYAEKALLMYEDNNN